MSHDPKASASAKGGSAGRIRRPYRRPQIQSGPVYERRALACIKVCEPFVQCGEEEAVAFPAS